MVVAVAVRGTMILAPQAAQVAVVAGPPKREVQAPQAKASPEALQPEVPMARPPVAEAVALRVLEIPALAPQAAQVALVSSPVSVVQR